MISNREKQAIKELAERQTERLGSQNKAANSLDIAPSTLSAVLNDKWEVINETMWRNIASKLNYTAKTWSLVETRDFKMITQICTDSQENANVFALVGNAGSGKSCTFRHFAENNKQVYLLNCNEFWNRKYFLVELLAAMGRDSSGLTVSEMMMEAVRILRTQQHPLIIMDEADKLSDQVLYFFITLYNQLEDQCGIILAATDHLEKRIRKGLHLNKKGYKEIYSRIGRKFIELRGIGSEDVAQVCKANGIDNKKDIQEIFQESDFDLRRVKRRIHGLKMTKKAQNN
ncbi:MAG: ATP-binding protein [Crocinitomicaceae bacterium]|jgi:DNA transposition AAA+ family ATPase|nr:ATP-binding protein [Crocinitomicaceae bacterium]